ncbi:hypothetical protein M0R45_020549 [Rubus argutus]|uniref:Uncharacterized protein n=1 Tax=Rubus argutus TaxID=59490 RepID=A0AAW1XA13_RUBAR
MTRDGIKVVLISGCQFPTINQFHSKPSQAFRYTTTVPPLHHHFAATIQGFIHKFKPPVHHSPSSIHPQTRARALSSCRAQTSPCLFLICTTAPQAVNPSHRRARARLRHNLQSTPPATTSRPPSPSLMPRSAASLHRPHHQHKLCSEPSRSRISSPLQHRPRRRVDPKPAPVITCSAASTSRALLSGVVLCSIESEPVLRPAPLSDLTSSPSH